MILASRFLRLTRPRMQGPDVISVQRRLIASKFYTGSWNGIYNTATAQAVVNFQRAAGIRADGIVGPVTWVVLGIGEVQWGGGSTHIVVDTLSNVLYLYQNNQLTNSFPVATGKPTTPTPLGDWVIVEKSPNPGGAFGPRWMRLSIPNGGYGIHGNDDPTSIGQSVSHGCVRMQNQDVPMVYAAAPIGTLVTITGAVVTTRVLHSSVSPGEDIATFQQMLNTLGFYEGQIDGVYGFETEEAVRDFQAAQRLTVDGVIGPQTALTIESQYDIALGDVDP